MSSKKRKKNRTVKAGILLVLICVILLAAVGLWMVLHDREQTGYAEVSSVGNGQTNTKTEVDTEYQYNDHLSNYLFLGIDTRESVEEEKVAGKAGQADAIMLVSYDRAEESVRLLAIPRDTITEIEMFNQFGDSIGFTEKNLTIQYGFGDGKRKSCELMTTAVSKLLNDLPIQGYCAVNLDAIAPATDEIGGVELTVSDDSLEEINPEFKAGSTVMITGENAEQFVRYRDTNQTQSAMVRQRRQKVFLKAYMEKAKSVAAKDSSLAVRLYDAVQDYMVTDMSNDLFTKLLLADQSSAEAETIPGEGVQGEVYDEYHVDEAALDEMIKKMFYKKL